MARELRGIESMGRSPARACTANVHAQGLHLREGLRREGLESQAGGYR